MMADYATLALTAARNRGLTASAVARLNYATTAELCGVAIVRGGSPADFHWIPTRIALLREIQADEEEAARNARLAAAQERLRQIFPEAVVMVDADGAERFFHDGKIPAGVTELPPRTATETTR